MTKVLRIHIGDEEREFTVKPFDELTVAEWVKIQDGGSADEDGEATLSRLLGMPKTFARRIPRDKAIELLGWYQRWLTDSMTVEQDIAAVREALKAREAQYAGEDRRMTHLDVQELFKAHGIHMDAVSVGDETFVVPQELGSTEYGQWRNMDTIGKEHGTGPEGILYAHLMANLCLKEGETFAEAPERFEVFMRARFIDALKVTSFFFVSDEDFRKTMLHYCPSFLKLPQPSTMPEVMST